MVPANFTDLLLYIVLRYIGHFSTFVAGKPENISIWFKLKIDYILCMYAIFLNLESTYPQHGKGWFNKTLHSPSNWKVKVV